MDLEKIKEEADQEIEEEETEAEEENYKRDRKEKVLAARERIKSKKIARNSLIHFAIAGAIICLIVFIILK